MAGGVEVAHVSDRGIPLVEGTPTVDDRLGCIEIRDKGANRRLLPAGQDPLAYGIGKPSREGKLSGYFQWSLSHNSISIGRPPS